MVGCLVAETNILGNLLSWSKPKHRTTGVSYQTRNHLLVRTGKSGIKTNQKYNNKKRKGVIEMRLVGLTGGIASGKSTISKLFKANGIPVVDADVVSRDVVRKGTGGWRRVVKEFGQEILQDDGEIDRAKLGQIIFSDPAKRQVLNRLLAPFISTGIFWEVFKLWMKGCMVIVLDIPLLFEAKMDRWTKPIVVVWIDPEKQLERLMARDGSSEEQARNRVDSQMALDWKRTKADIVIDNSGSLEETKEQFQKALAQIMGPLSWTEFMLSRSGAFSVLVSVIVAVVACRSML